MPVGIELWVAELCSDALLEPLRDEMFESLRFLVNLFEGVVEKFVKECFDQSMMAHHLKRPPLSPLSTEELRGVFRIPPKASETLPASAAYW